jgi:hypothetical protein
VREKNITTSLFFPYRIQNIATSFFFPYRIQNIATSLFFPYRILFENLRIRHHLEDLGTKRR